VKKILKWGAVVLVALVAIAAATGSGDDDKSDSAAGDTTTTTGAAGDAGDATTTTAAPAGQDADLNPGFTCEADEVGWLQIKGTVTNHSSKNSDYFLEFRGVDAAGVNYSSPLATVSNVAPGQTAEFEASDLTDFRDGTTCEIVSLERNEAL
jgi:hypothetical protein